MRRFVSGALIVVGAGLSAGWIAGVVTHGDRATILGFMLGSMILATGLVLRR